MNIAKFFDHVSVWIDDPTEMGQRLGSLLLEMISRLPEEAQFNTKGSICFVYRSNAIQLFPKSRGFADFSVLGRVGNCLVIYDHETTEVRYILTFILDKLHKMPDAYIKGLIAHELGEMSYMAGTYMRHKPDFKNMSVNKKELWHRKFLPQGDIGSRENLRHEYYADQEAIRLGFSEELSVSRSLCQNI